MKRTLLLAIIIACGLAWSSAEAGALSGVFNTGVSDVDDSDGESIDVKFHPCDYDLSLTCGTIVDVREPNGPSGRDTLPNGEKVIGFRIIEDLKDFGEGEFKRGRINAIDETIAKNKMVWYGLRVKDNRDGTLTARGCLGFVCPRAMTWVASDPGEGVSGEGR